MTSILIDVTFSDKSVQNLVDINITSIKRHSVTDVSVIPDVENLVKLSRKMTIPDDENQRVIMTPPFLLGD